MENFNDKQLLLYLRDKHLGNLVLNVDTASRNIYPFLVQCSNKKLGLREYNVYEFIHIYGLSASILALLYEIPYSHRKVKYSTKKLPEKYIDYIIRWS